MTEVILTLRHSNESQLPPTSIFFTLPLEIRQCIYVHALNWPDLSQLFQARLLEIKTSEEQDISYLTPLCTIPRPRFQFLSTPSILLINKQITTEALEVLYRKPFILTSPPPYVSQLARPEDITDFISESALQNLRFVVLEMDMDSNPSQTLYGAAKCWLKTVEMLLDIWCVRNSLERVEIKVAYEVPSKEIGWDGGEVAHHRHVTGLIQRLRGFGEQVPLILEGYAGERLKRGGPPS